MKSRSDADSLVVRKAVGNWRALLIAEVMVFRDSSAGTVTDPGWCVGSLRAGRADWVPVLGDSMPQGGRRRGWNVVAGRSRLVIIGKPKSLGGDSASAEFALTVAPNENGRALAVDQDSVRYRAAFMRDGGTWRAVLPRTMRERP